MATVVIADLIIPPEGEAKIRQKPNHRLTGQEVREAVVYAVGAQARWVEDEEHGRRAGSVYSWVCEVDGKEVASAEFLVRSG